MKIKIFFLITLGLLFVTSCGKGIDQVGHMGACDVYANWETSDYVLPYSVGDSHEVSQGNCSAYSHFGKDRYAYDFLMPIGTNLVAARAGEVIAVVENFTDGNGCPDENHVKIRHSDGTIGAYLHLTVNGSLVSVGDTVTQGQSIATSGNTGCSTDPHLHFVVFLDSAEKDSVPVTFSNTSANPRGAMQGKTYTAR
ncbi:MAG: M23 family metallopeptidase [Bdellovibrio sp.]|nr:M23 family metallopeptidase [Bdellovibrio sp.]